MAEPDPDNRPLRMLRARYWALFGAAAVISLALFALIARLIASPTPDDASRTRALLLMWVLVLMVLAVSGLAWWLIYRAAFRDIFRFADELWIVAHGDAATRLGLPSSPLLTPLAESTRLLAQRLAQLRHESDRLAAASAIRVEGEKVRLEAILRDLSEAVVVCDLESRVLLYNHAALLLLSPAGELGLGRSLFNVAGREPIRYTLEMLRERQGAGERDDLQADFVGSTVKGERILLAHLRLILESDGSCKSYVLALTDATQELEEVRQRDALLTATTEGMRAPVTNLLAASEMLGGYPDMAPEQRRGFDEVIHKEVRALKERLEAAIGEHRKLVTRGWPLYDLFSADVVARVARALGGDGVALTPTGAPLWLRGDGLALAHALEALARRVAGEQQVARLDAATSIEGTQPYLDLVWTGRPILPATLEAWLDAPLPGLPGAMSLRDVVARHDSELWSDAVGDEQARLRFPLPRPDRPQRAARDPLPPRPVFYDFELLERMGNVGSLGERSLRGLDFVVLDTETTGLSPGSGDAIVSLAGVRVVNGRVLAGETFARLVNPRMPIPASSTTFHGITDEMVRDKPPIEVVLHQFHGFCAGAVLVAHNAAFDMKFITLGQGAAGVLFDHPVLDTQLLATAIGGDWLDRSLDGLAERLGVTVRARHTALGDALTTAEVLVRMIPLLEAAGVETLARALAVCRRALQLAPPPDGAALRGSGP
jgi:DNA polymerase-3 subunit epsilon